VQLQYAALGLWRGFNLPGLLDLDYRHDALRLSGREAATVRQGRTAAHLPGQCPLELAPSVVCRGCLGVQRDIDGCRTTGQSLRRSG
jgi:hypothetical protein